MVGDDVRVGSHGGEQRMVVVTPRDTLDQSRGRREELSVTKKVEAV